MRPPSKSGTRQEDLCTERWPELVSILMAGASTFPIGITTAVLCSLEGLWRRRSKAQTPDCAGLGDRPTSELHSAIGQETIIRYRLVGLAISPVAVVMWLEACATLPANQRADVNRQYRTEAFVVAPPPGRWMLDSVAQRKGWRADDPYVCGEDRFRPAFEGVIVDSAFAEQRFLHVAKPQLISAGEPNPWGDLDGCMVITAYRLVRLERFSGGPSSIVDSVRARLPSITEKEDWFNEWHRTVARMTPLQVGERVLYWIRMVAVDDSSLVLEKERGQLLLEVRPPDVYAFYFWGLDVRPSDPEWIVVKSLVPLH